MRHFVLLIVIIGLFGSCQPKTETLNTADHSEEFQFLSETFADLKILRYQIPDFDKLTLDQKKLVYYLSEAGKSGRDITYDQNYRYNLVIRKALEGVITNYSGDREEQAWLDFMTYVKRIWFANGIHHHYSNDKIMPKFSRAYLERALKISGRKLPAEVLDIMFDEKLDNKRVNLDEAKGLLAGSAVNYYDPSITAEDAETFYSELIDKEDSRPISYGLNSKLVKDKSGKLKEEVWKSGGMYGAAIDKIIYWLEKAVTVAENDAQKKGLELLIEYYKTGDLKIWDQYNIVWTGATEGDIDYINGFIEVYNDPIGYRGAYESIVQIKDFEASDRMLILSKNVQWFEDNSPVADQHKKPNVVGVSYKVVNVASGTGDASPSSPFGVNLPNADWIRSTYGSKSVSLGNILHVYNNVGTEGFLEEFYYRDEEIGLTKKYGGMGDKILTALHEVIGHASGQINEGVGTPKETLKSYASTIEEGRADLVALYFLMDQKLIDLGLIPNFKVAKEQYGSYITNGLVTQLQRLKLGQQIEEAHMRNRAWIAAWCYEKGLEENVIEKIIEKEKTYFVVNDFDKLRLLFGELLKETQRIKSEGDFEAAKDLVENYGVKVDADLHAEVLSRSEKLKSAPYSGFINPELVPVLDENNEITDIIVEYPDNFKEQMLYYSKNYSFL